MTCPSAGEKNRSADCGTLRLGVGGCLCLQGRAVHQKVWVAATNATFPQNTIGHSHLSPRGHLQLFFCSSTSEDRTLQSVIRSYTGPPRIVARQRVRLVTRM